jgi:hypothetical protein
VLARVRRQLDRTCAPGLADLLAELESYPGPERVDGRAGTTEAVAMPLRLASDHGELALLYTTTVFGAVQDVTLDEIAIETFFPADDRTKRLLQVVATSRR